MPDSKRHKGGKRPQKGTGHFSDKDRSTHQSARGEKVETLADLSRQQPTTGDFTEMVASFTTESDRGCALIAGSFLENTLKMALEGYVVDYDETFLDKLFVGSDAPMGTFSAMIKMGRALGFYDKGIQAQLETLKAIRNAFAHAQKPINFSQPTVVSHCEKLIVAKHSDPNHVFTPRERYTAFCVAFGRKLIDLAVYNAKRDKKVIFFSL